MRSLIHRFLVFALVSLAAGMHPAGAWSSDVDKEGAAFKKYNHLILTFPKAYRPWTTEEVNTLMNLKPDVFTDKKELFKIKNIVNAQATAMEKDLQYLQSIYPPTPDLALIHGKLLDLVSRMVNVCRRMATTLGTRRKSNYDVILKDLLDLRHKLAQTGALYESQCRIYGIANPAITGDYLWSDPKSFGKRK